MFVLQTQYRAVYEFHLNSIGSDPRAHRVSARVSPCPSRALHDGVILNKINQSQNMKNIKKPKICTADELHYVAVPTSDWRLSLWRYLPSTEEPKRNHPLLLLSGIGTNAIGYDLSPESSFARYMSGQGFDTWILEVRGAGLSTPGLGFTEVKKPLNDSVINGKRAEMVSISEESQSESQLLETVMQLTDRLSGFLNVEGQWPLAPQFKGRLSTLLEDFLKELELVIKNDWDFDHYLEEDVPAVMEYIRTLSKPKDGKLHAVGHSMGGILLYAMQSRYCNL